MKQNEHRGMYLGYTLILILIVKTVIENSNEITTKLSTFIKTKHWNIYELWSIALSGDIDKNDRYTFIYIHWCMWQNASYLRGYVMTTKVLLQCISFKEFEISHIFPFSFLNIHFYCHLDIFPRYQLWIRIFIILNWFID